MVHMNLQLFGGRGSEGGKSTKTQNAEVDMKNLNAAQRGYVNELESMNEGDLINIGGFDFSVIEKAAYDGESWAEDIMDGGYELPGQYIKIDENTWEAATYSSYPPTYTKAEMMDIIRRTKKANSKDKKAMQKWLRDIEG